MELPVARGLKQRGRLQCESCASQAARRWADLHWKAREVPQGEDLSRDLKDERELIKWKRTCPADGTVCAKARW